MILSPLRWRSSTFSPGCTSCASGILSSLCIIILLFPAVLIPVRSVLVSAVLVVAPGLLALLALKFLEFLSFLAVHRVVLAGAIAASAPSAQDGQIAHVIFVEFFLVVHFHEDADCLAEHIDALHLAAEAVISLHLVSLGRVRFSSS